MHLTHARHQFSVFCGASHQCARASAAVCSQEEITSTSTCSRSATAGVTNSSKARLRAPSGLSVASTSQLTYQNDPHPRHRHRCCHQACFSSFTRPGRSLPKGWAPCLLLNSGRRTSIPANLDNGCSSSQNFLLMASWLALSDKLSSSFSRIIAVRKRCIRVLFLAVSTTHQERRGCWPSVCSLECGAGDSEHGRCECASPCLNLDSLVCKRRSMIFVAVCPNTQPSFVSVCPKRLKWHMRCSTAPL